MSLTRPILDDGCLTHRRNPTLGVSIGPRRCFVLATWIAGVLVAGCGSTSPDPAESQPRTSEAVFCETPVNVLGQTSLIELGAGATTCDELDEVGRAIAVEYGRAADPTSDGARVAYTTVCKALADTEPWPGDPRIMGFIEAIEQARICVGGSSNITLPDS